jgi:hypothetical protein
MPKENTEQSKNWDEINALQPTEIFVRFFKAISMTGFPCCYRGASYELIMNTGNRQHKCWVDDSKQYEADGKSWRDSEGNFIEKYHVVAWKEIP